MLQVMCLWFVISAVLAHDKGAKIWNVKNCRNTLQLGQFVCPHPESHPIDPETQEYFGCNEENKAEVSCLAAPGIHCEDGNGPTFTRTLPCRWTNGYNLDTALLLSVFFGMLGADRFYLGYPAMGLLKLCTLGFLFVGQLVDIILIVTQTVGPADGSNYVIPYYGARVTVLSLNNDSYFVPNKDWIGASMAGNFWNKTCFLNVFA